MATDPDLVSMSKVLDFIAIEVAKNGQATAELRKEMLTGFERVEVRFARVDERFDGLDRRVDGLDRRVGRLELRVEEVEDGIKAIRSDIGELKRRTR
jgi:archaellum component FlaC